MATQNVAINTAPTQSAVEWQKTFNLSNGVLVRAATLGNNKFSGVDVLNVICVIAAHINGLTRKTWVSPRTVAAETGLRPKVAEAIIAHAVANGILQPGTWQGKPTLAFISNDKDSGGYRFISLQWWIENAALGKSRGLLQHLLALADGNRRFSANVRKELAPRLGVSYGTLYRLLAPLVTREMVRTRQHGRRATQFEMPCVPRKRPQGVTRSPQGVTSDSQGVTSSPSEPAPDAAFRTEGYVLQVNEVQDTEPKSKTGFGEHDVRSPKTGDAHPRPIPPIREEWLHITGLGLLHSSARALPPLTPDEYGECWHIIKHRTRETKLDGPPLRMARVSGVLRVAKSEGFLRHQDDYGYFDDNLRQLAEAHVSQHGPHITNKQGFRMICDALRGVLGYDEQDSMLGTMGPEADLPNCPRAVYSETHGGVM